MKINRVSFTINALLDYQYRQKRDRKALKVLNKIIDDIVYTVTKDSIIIIQCRYHY